MKLVAAVAVFMVLLSGVVALNVVLSDAGRAGSLAVMFGLPALLLGALVIVACKAADRKQRRRPGDDPEVFE